MKEKIKVVQIGCGKMSKYIMKYVYDKGGEIVGAVDVNENIIGKDIGHVMDDENKGVLIDDLKKLDEILNRKKPHIAVVTTMSFLNDISEVSRICLKNGVNVITTCEEAFYGANSNPTLFKELDVLAKANGVTMVGCGYQDVFWGNLVSALCGSMHIITKIKGSSSYNVEDYGLALALAHGAGFSKEKFKKEIADASLLTKEEREKLMDNREFFPSYMWNVVGWLSDKLKLHVTDISQECVPVMCDNELYSETLNMQLEEGMVRGMNAIVTANTQEGIIFEVECIGKVYNKDEFDKNVWTVYGEPTTTLVNDRPDTVLLTCADIVNRIPDVINARPGFVSTSEFDSPKFIVNEF